MKGYSGKILHVNLTNGSFRVEEPKEMFYRKYFGGAAMGAWYVMKGMKGGVDALSADNVLAFTISAITGAPVSGNARHCVSTKSPLTGTIAHSESGGFWGPQLKFAGFDGIIITGRAPKPVYLSVINGKYELRDALEIWGKTTGDSQDWIRADLDEPKVRVALIGPGGERGVRFAGIVNELKHFNGRSGMGAVMGSKNLKAVAVRGDIKPEFHDPDAIRTMAKEAGSIMKTDEFYQAFKRAGTTQNVEWNTPAGGLPTRNWTQGTFEDQDKMMGERYAEEMMEGSGTCWSCVQACKRDIKSGITSPVNIDPKFGGPEYETIGMCGSNLGISDFNVIAAINQTASMYAVDSISLGGVIGLAMECYEKGIITAADTDGLELNFGNAEAAMKLAELVCKKEGFGAVLSEGSAKAAASIGSEAEKLAVHVKNKEFPAHMPQTKASLGLAYAVNPFGPDHVTVEHDGGIAADPLGERVLGFGLNSIEDPAELSIEKAKLVAYSQRWAGAIDSVNTCNFIFNTWTMFGIDKLMELITAVTGWEFSMWEFMLLGERKLNMLKLFNEREGFTEADDVLPEKLFEQPLQDDGPSNGGNSQP